LFRTSEHVDDKDEYGIKKDRCDRSWLK